MAGSPLTDDVWSRRGISLLWDAEALATACSPDKVVSLRQFLHLWARGWPDRDMPLVNDELLVVAGLEAAIDALPPEQATDWLEQHVYKAIVSYQREVADGGGQAALVLWLTEHKRLDYQTADDTYTWRCSTEHRGSTIPISRCLFNGAEQDLRRIMVTDAGQPTERWAGLFHPRIS